MGALRLVRSICIVCSESEEMIPSEKNNYVFHEKILYNEKKTKAEE